MIPPKKKPTTSKKSINFELCSVEIGQWKRVAEREGVIVGKCFFARKELVWEFHPVSNQKKVRVVIRWTKITAASYSELDGGNGLIEIELNEKPRFDEEKDVHAKHSSYMKALDFTEGNASKYRRHRIEMAPHIISRYFFKLKEDDDTPLRKALEHPFRYGPSSTFEAGNLIAAPEPVALANTVRESRNWLTEFPGSRNQQPVHIAKRAKLEHTITPPRNLVHETAHWSDPLLRPQRIEDFSSWTRGSILPQQTNLEPTIPSTFHGTTDRFYPPFRPQQTEVSGSWAPGPVIPHQTKPEPTIPNVVHETTYGFHPPFQPQQTEESCSWTPGPVLPHKTRPEPTVPNELYESTYRFDPPFQPQQTEASGSCTPGPVLPHQTRLEPTIPNAFYDSTYGFDPPFQPQQTEASGSCPQRPVPSTNMAQHMAPWSDLPVYAHQTEIPSSWTQGPSTSQPWFDLPLPDLYQYQIQPDPAPPSQQGHLDPFDTNADFLPFDTNYLDPSIADPLMTFQGPPDSEDNHPAGLDSIQPGQY